MQMHTYSSFCIIPCSRFATLRTKTNSTSAGQPCSSESHLVQQKPPMTIMTPPPGFTSLSSFPYFVAFPKFLLSLLLSSPYYLAFLLFEKAWSSYTTSSKSLPSLSGPRYMVGVLLHLISPRTCSSSWNSLIRIVLSLGSNPIFFPCSHIAQKSCSFTEKAAPPP